MAKNSKIEWTHHTFNPWWGCTKVSNGCRHCYAEVWARRVGSQVWGPDSPRRFFGKDHWQHPLKWDAEASRVGQRHRVFCASMADVFEDRRDLDAWRVRLWGLIDATPNLDWLLLTKRPESIEGLVPWQTAWPRNLWLGTTVESQPWADTRISHLLRQPAAVRFLSCEPLLGPLDLGRWAGSAGIHWVIAGGESGPQARPMNPEWVRDLRDQCRRVGIAFHFKQWGHWCPGDAAQPGSKAKTVSVSNADGQTLRLFAAGKRAAGRTLDGRHWDELPTQP